MTNDAVIADAAAPAAATIETAEDAFLLLAPEAAGQTDAKLWRIDLGAQNRVLGRELVADRGADTIMIHPRRVFRGALAAGAAKVVLVHNHPAQDLALTDADRILTDIMAIAGDSIGIPVLDLML